MASQPEAKLRDWSLTDVWRGLNKPVFLISVILILGGLVAATLYGNAAGEDAAAAFDELNATIVNSIGWWYVILGAAFVAFALWAGLSKAGNIRLGRDDEKPEFSLGSWFTMLFAAGMGIGLVFWGVAEPLWHFTSPPEVTGDLGVNEAGEPIAATQSAAMGDAMGLTIFHWGLHAWAMYVIVGLGLAYMTFRRGRPLSIRWLLEPIFGRKLIESWVGHVIDIVAIVGTVFGVVTSLGLGTQQIAAGLGFMGWADTDNEWLLTGLVVVIMAIATISVVTGVHKGLKWLSNVNMVIAALMAFFVLIAGPTLFLLQSFVGNIGEYLMAFPQLLFETGADYAGTGAGIGEDEEGGWTLLGGWSADWTIYYWGWWMSWAPFVGMFIARISRGRTIREFVLGVLLAPTLVGIVWFSIFGNAGLWYLITRGEESMLVEVLDDDGNVVLDEAGNATYTVGNDESLFLLLENLPWTSILAVVAIIVITTFFITSGDSGSLVTDVLAYGGRTETPKLTRVFWTALIALTAIVLLAAAQDPAASLRVLQVSSIAAAAPLSIVYALAMISQIRLFLYEGRTMNRYVRVRRHATKAALVETAREAAGTGEEAAVQKNLLELLNRQTRSLRSMFGSASATLAGLPASSGTRKLAEGKASHDLVIAVEDVPAHATTVDESTGVLGWDRSMGWRDPLEEATFETPEFSESYVGWEQESEEFFDETLATGTIPVVEPENEPKKNDDA
ncbi:BCCT family transporter [Nesterenkonia flava]|uniref:BCCT family transporter n=1 Tax=Nesterenkonia flava TaxID=469799 RepID=A0ABU1FTJ5_9MICC|nr:BCCT family transporter [Nesterenkonia flava]MDR5711972.1 BCCT family transporter [Nesterenkonia flava]